MDADALGSEVTGTRPVRTPEHRPPDPFGGRDLEPPLLAALGGGGLALAWSSGAGRGAWTAAATVGVLAASAWLARRRGPRPPAFVLRATRAGLTLAAAAVAVGVGSGPSTGMLAWFPAACAVYAVVLQAPAATAFTTAILGVLAALAGAAPAAGPSPTAFAACASAVVAVGLAARTLRAVLETQSPGDAPATPGPSSTSPISSTSTMSSTSTGVSTPELPAADAGPHPAGLPDRDQLLDAVTRAQARAGVVGGSVGLLVLTVEGAAGLAASLGPGPAQEVLDILARRARAWLPAGDVVAWLPGGRLAVLLEGVDAATCTVIARRLAALLAEPVEAGPSVLSLPSSAALALAEGPHEDPADVLGRAEAAPRLAEADLAGTVPPAPPAAPDRLVEDLWPALCAGEVTVALQPIVALGALPRHDHLVAFEALARWTRPDGVGVPPARFVPAARRSGLADLLGATVLAHGLDALARRRSSGPQTLGLSINVAPEQLTGPSFATTVLRALEAAGVEPSALTVEIPAGAAFPDAGTASATLGALRDAGVGVLLDNFGATGLSMAALRDLPLSGVKLDRSLTADLGVDDRLVVATVRLTTRLGLTCTAVGIETQAQLDAARSLGIDAVQGHLLGRPEGKAEPAGMATRAATGAAPAADGPFVAARR
jgi:EAL domain-containing protein (putative c-di-GMP-specific phosphodiesterase class I)/GGDEF domain-containing protein